MIRLVEDKRQIRLKPEPHNRIGFQPDRALTIPDQEAVFVDDAVGH